MSADDQQAAERVPAQLDPNYNPLLAKWQEYNPGTRRGRFWSTREMDLEMKGFGARRELCRDYAWAIPTPEAVDAIAALGPIVEIGAGAGYWAMMLRLLGCVVHAYDSHPPYGEDGPDANHYHKGAVCWSPVRKGGPEMVAEHPDSTLFLCWPPYNEPMAAEALALYTGDRVVYIGEGDGGCTADDAFHEALGLGFVEEREIEIPQWCGIHDTLRIFKRGTP